MTHRDLYIYIFESRGRVENQPEVLVFAENDQIKKKTAMRVVYIIRIESM